jgi:high-affinity iron transporter
MGLRRFLIAGFACAAMFCSAAAPAEDPALLVHLLDYIAVDYGAAVADGKVKSPEEYKEMTEFAAHVTESLGRLPSVPDKAGLAQRAESLQKLVATRASPAEVAAAATALRQAAVAAYKVPVGPKRAPDMARAAVLYAQHCSGCHGATGLGDGPLAKGLDPAPANFHDRARQDQRSIHGLFNTLSLGVNGTSMRAFTELDEADRWALAFYAAQWGASDESAARGKALWESGRFHAELGSQAAIAGQSAVEVKAKWGDDAVDALAFLRRNPTALYAGKAAPLEFAREKLAESVTLYRRGESAAAVQSALTAYLEGFELVEAPLATVDEPLMRDIELLMIDLRSQMKSGAPVTQIEGQAARIDKALEQARDRLGEGGLSPLASFLASFVILLREGLEAVLVVAALIAFLRRSGQARALPYLHAGWILALAFGALTWIVATRMVQISGASREVTEGVTGLIASAMLLYVGFWLHDKSHAKAWQAFLMQGVEVIKPGAAWGLAFMTFLAVYREVFETVLFYEALWGQAPDQGSWIVAGLGCAVASLAIITWAMLRYSVRLPLGLFFGASGVLLAVLAVVMAGNGIAALQEAGIFPITPVPFITVKWLGIHPNLQALGLQILLTIFTVVLLRLSTRRATSVKPGS